MGKQKHDLGVQKRAKNDDVERAARQRRRAHKREEITRADASMTNNHPPKRPGTASMLTGLFLFIFFRN
jgi:hypothetical protein